MCNVQEEGFLSFAHVLVHGQWLPSSGAAGWRRATCGRADQKQREEGGAQKEEPPFQATPVTPFPGSPTSEQPVRY